MKTIRMLLTIALLSGAVSVYTQAETRPLVKVSIPFSFTVGKQSLPAGDYTISAFHPQLLIQLQSADGKQVGFAGTHPRYALNPSTRTELIFQRYGSTYFLSQIWTQGDTSGLELPLSNRAKEMAKNGSSGDATAIVAEGRFSQ
jgi:hypothetical protein